MRMPFSKRTPAPDGQDLDMSATEASYFPLRRSLAEMMATGELLDDETRRLGEMVEQILDPALEPREKRAGALDVHDANRQAPAMSRTPLPPPSAPLDPPKATTGSQLLGLTVGDQAPAVKPLALVAAPAVAPEPRQEAPAEAAAPLTITPPPAAATRAPLLPLETVVARQTPLFWYEAVAIVERACAAVLQPDGRELPPPDLTGILIGADGTVQVRQGNGAEPPVSRLGRVLHTLVPPESTPPRLRLFITQWVAATDMQSVRALAADLAYFARPNPDDLIAAVYARCMERPPIVAAPSSVDPEEALERSEPGSNGRRLRTALIAGVAAASVVLAAFLVWNLPLWGMTGVSATSTAADLVEDTGTAVEEPAAAISPPPAAPPVTRAVSAVASGGTRIVAPEFRTPDLPRAPAVAVAEVKPPNAADPVAVTLDAPLPVALDTPPTAPLDVVATSTTGFTQVFSSVDPDVEPPRLRSAEIPELLISGFDVRTNVVELVVSESGDVERARMVGALQRMPDLMLLSRAKAWTFDPATLNGQPVRYRLLLTWNVSP